MAKGEASDPPSRQIWEGEGFPSLSPKVPWHGCPLGDWAKEYEEAADPPLKGAHYWTAEKLAKERIKP